MNHSSLILDEMKVKMAVSIRKLDSKNSNVMYKDENSLEDVVSRTAFKVTLCDQGIPCESNGRSVDIEMTFKSGDAPESVARLVDQLLNGSCPYSPVSKRLTRSRQYKGCEQICLQTILQTAQRGRS